MARPAAKELIYPGWDDARWYQTAFLGSFVVYALLAPSFARTPAQFAAGMLVCLSFDFVLAYRNRGILLLPVSGLISSLGLLLICNSPFVWPYMLVALLSVLSKQYLRVDGRHVFNPTNFGLTVGLLFFSGDMTTSPSRWGGSAWGAAALACLGALVAYKGKRLDCAASWVATFLLGAFVRSRITEVPFAILLGPMTGASFVLFTFFMITDPVTTPRSLRSRLAFGTAVGALDAFMRYHRVYNAPFYALFLVSGFTPLLQELFKIGDEASVWKPKTVSLG